MPKLHELLAVDSNLKGQADKCRTDLLATFDKKRHLFTEKLVTFKPLSEGAPAQTEEQTTLQSTVSKELAWLSGVVANSLDVSYQIAETNTLARADVVLEDGTVLVKNAPATALLELEKRVNEVHALVSGIPTLDPAKNFSVDDQRERGVWRAREEKRVRTVKEPRVLTLAPATDKHPAQVQAYNVDVPTGELITVEWSGLITPAQKASMLERVEVLRRAVKSARSRANATDAIVGVKVGQRLLDYVFNI